MAKKRSRLKRWLWRGFFSLLVLSMAVFWYLDVHFSLRGNLYLLAYWDSAAPLKINTLDGWKPVSATTPTEMLDALEPLYQHNGVIVQKLSLRRAAADFPERAADWFLPSELVIFTFAADTADWRVSFLPGFKPGNAPQARARDYASFAVNANFFDPDGKPLGRVIHNHKEVNKAFPTWSGYFFVKNGKAWCGPKSLFEKAGGDVAEAVQVYPSIMKDHTVFSYVEFQPDRYFDGKKITYRSLAGMKADGSIVWILSGPGGVLNIGEIADVASKLNIQHATMMDGGRALQYDFDDGEGKFSFHSYNTDLKLPWKQLDQVLCPVFLTAGLRGRSPEKSLLPDPTPRP